MRVLAIDPGEKNSAFAVLDSFGKSSELNIHPTWWKKLTFPKKSTECPSWEKANWWFNQYKPILWQGSPDVVVLEYPALRGHRLFDIGSLHYAFLHILIENKFDFIHLSSGAWKLCFCGRGKAEPHEYRDKVNEFFGYTETPIKSYDSAAAIAMGYVGLRFWCYKKGYITKEDLTKQELRKFTKTKLALDKREGFMWRFFNE